MSHTFAIVTVRLLKWLSFLQSYSVFVCLSLSLTQLGKSQCWCASIVSHSVQAGDNFRLTKIGFDFFRLLQINRIKRKHQLNAMRLENDEYKKETEKWEEKEKEIKRANKKSQLHEKCIQRRSEKKQFTNEKKVINSHWLKKPHWTSQPPTLCRCFYHTRRSKIIYHMSYEKENFRKRKISSNSIGIGNATNVTYYSAYCILEVGSRL